MSTEDQLSPQQRQWEAALSALQPAPPAMDRDRLMFRAGQLSGRRRGRMWQGASGLLGLMLAASLTVQLAPRAARQAPMPTPGPVQRQAGFFAAGSPAGQAEQAIPREATYLKLRSDVLERGLDALPATRYAWAEPVRLEFAESLLDGQPRKQTPPPGSPLGLGWLFRSGEGT